MQEPGLDLSQLDRLLGDVLLEGEIARTAQTAVYRVRTGAADASPLPLKVPLRASAPEDLRVSATRSVSSPRLATRTWWRSTTSASCPATSPSSPWRWWGAAAWPSGFE